MLVVRFVWNQHSVKERLVSTLVYKVLTRGDQGLLDSHKVLLLGSQQPCWLSRLIDIHLSRGIDSPNKRLGAITEVSQVLPKDSLLPIRQLLHCKLANGLAAVQYQAFAFH